MKAFRTATLFSALCAASAASHAVEHCFDFSRMPVGTVYRLNDVYVDSLLEVHMRDFYWNGSPVKQGDANVVSVSNTSLALGGAPEIHTYLMNAQVVPNTPIRKVTMKIAQNVGVSGQSKVNLGVNGELREMAGLLSQADGKHMGMPGLDEVEVRVSLTPDGGTSYWHRGTLSMKAIGGGVIKRFTFGGQSLNVDDVCLEW
jgi:hypothetical protein